MTRRYGRCPRPTPHPGRRGHRVSLRVTAPGERAGDQDRAADIRARRCRCRACFLSPPRPWVVRHSHELWPNRGPSGRLGPWRLRKGREAALGDLEAHAGAFVDHLEQNISARRELKILPACTCRRRVSSTTSPVARCFIASSAPITKAPVHIKRHRRDARSATERPELHPSVNAP